MNPKKTNFFERLKLRLQFFFDIVDIERTNIFIWGIIPLETLQNRPPPKSIFEQLS